MLLRCLTSERATRHPSKEELEGHNTQLIPVFYRTSLVTLYINTFCSPNALTTIV